MITYLKCDDFKEKQYLDELDESFIFVRKEECQHYAINMKRKLNGQKYKFEITVDCKKCQRVTRQDFYKSKGEFIFNCPNCGCCKMNFKYYNSNTDEIEGQEEIHVMLPEEKKKEKDSQVINIGLSQYKNDKLLAGEEGKKIYKTPDNNNQVFEFPAPPVSNSLINNNNINNNQYYKPVNNNNNNFNNNSNNANSMNIIPNSDISNNNISNNNNNCNNNNDKGKEVTITFVYNEEKYEMKFSNLDSIEKKYDIIQEKLNFQGIKYFYYNEVNLDIKKPLTDYDITFDVDIEILDKKYDN